MTVENTRYMPEPESVRVQRRKPLGTGAIFGLWAGSLIALHSVLWITGFQKSALTQAVEQGAARAEVSRVGEVTDDIIRKAIHLQHQTLSFWTTLAHLGDFLFGPTLLIGRAVVLATIFASIAALSGRSIGFNDGLRAVALAQGYWVLALLVKVALTVALRREDIETSLALLLPQGRYPAALVVAIRQLDPFAALGWISVAWGGWRRHQVNLATAIFVCLMVACGETTLRVAGELMMGAGMRLSILPR